MVLMSRCVDTPNTAKTRCCVPHKEVIFMLSRYANTCLSMLQVCSQGPTLYLRNFVDTFASKRSLMVLWLMSRCFGIPKIAKTLCFTPTLYQRSLSDTWATQHKWSFDCSGYVSAPLNIQTYALIPTEKGPCLYNTSALSFLNLSSQF